MSDAVTKLDLASQEIRAQDPDILRMNHTGTEWFEKDINECILGGVDFECNFNASFVRDHSVVRSAVLVIPGKVLARRNSPIIKGGFGTHENDKFEICKTPREGKVFLSVYLYPIPLRGAALQLVTVSPLHLYFVLSARQSTKRVHFLPSFVGGKIQEHEPLSKHIASAKSASSYNHVHQFLPGRVSFRVYPTPSLSP